MHKGIHVALFPVAKADEKRRVSTMRGGLVGQGGDAHCFSVYNF